MHPKDYLSTCGAQRQFSRKQGADSGVRSVTVVNWEPRSAGGKGSGVAREAELAALEAVERRVLWLSTAIIWIMPTGCGRTPRA
ncbi:hypothetical protein SANTM175S_00264 [Streptomyces antimycoticus]